MIIAGEHKVKLVKKALLVLMASIEASLRIIIDPDLASGYALLNQNAETTLCKIKPFQRQLALVSYVEQHTVLVALDKILTEYQGMRQHNLRPRDCEELRDLYAEIEREHQKEIDDPESRKKIPAIVTLTSGLRPSGLGTG